MLKGGLERKEMLTGGKGEFIFYPHNKSEQRFFQVLLRAHSSTG